MVAVVAAGLLAWFPPAELAAGLRGRLGLGVARVTFPEGFDRFDVAARLEARGVCGAAAFVAATEDAALLRRLDLPGPSAEGYLFPETYDFRPQTPPDVVVERMVAELRRRLVGLLERHAAGLARLEADLGFGVHEVITLASIVEREAVRDEERPIIAGVFLNRLRAPDFVPRRLQADPTVSYGCRADRAGLPSCLGHAGAITRAMLDDAANPYNTYRHEGLPPGPIANPGEASLRAVLAPAAHDYLYFVASGGGRHAFSRTLAEHEAATRRHLGR